MRRRDLTCNDTTPLIAVPLHHYNEVIMSALASQITSLTIVYSTVCSGVDQRKHQSSASLAFVRGIHRWSVNSPHKWPVTREMFPFDDVIVNFFQQHAVYSWSVHAFTQRTQRTRDAIINNDIITSCVHWLLGVATAHALCQPMVKMRLRWLNWNWPSDTLPQMSLTKLWSLGSNKTS